MKKTLFTGIREVLTMAGAMKKGGRKVGPSDLSMIPKAAILVDEMGLIEWIGPEKECSFLSLSADTLKISLKDQTVVPSFIECHTHSLFAGDRTPEFEMRLLGASYQEISKKGGGIRSTMKATREASDQSLKNSLAQRLENFRRQGVSTVEVKTGYGLSVAEELRQLRLIKDLSDNLISPTFLGPHSSSPEFANLDDYLTSVIDEALPVVAQDHLAQRVDIFIEAGFFTPDQAERYFRKAQSLNLEISVHAEQLTWSGGIQKALQFGAKSVDHCVNVNENDIAKLASSETTAVLLPSADLYMEIPYPPARRLIDQGVRVALSTDFNPGSSPSQSIELCSLLARVQMKMSLPEIFSAWTVAPAHVLSIESKQGSLEKGKRADFSVWNKSWSSFFYDFSEIHPQEVYLLGKRVAFT